MFTSWILGLGFSLILGHLCVDRFHARLHQYLVLGPKSPLGGEAARVPAWLTGLVERLFFTVLVGVHGPGFSTVMMFWLGLKLVTNWNHPDYGESSAARTFAYSGLLSGLLSMLFALVGGLICGSAL